MKLFALAILALAATASNEVTFYSRRTIGKGVQTDANAGEVVVTETTVPEDAEPWQPVSFTSKRIIGGNW